MCVLCAAAVHDETNLAELEAPDDSEVVTDIAELLQSNEVATFLGTIG